MIEYHYEVNFCLDNSSYYTDWITRVIESENMQVGTISYIFCSDEYLLNLNRNYLHHDTLTDIITFEYTKGPVVSGDIFISVERVRENADLYEVDPEDETRRVMIHGVLHMMGYSDSTNAEKQQMRDLEEAKMKMFHVEQQ